MSGTLHEDLRVVAVTVVGDVKSPQKPCLGVKWIWPLEQPKRYKHTQRCHNVTPHVQSVVLSANHNLTLPSAKRDNAKGISRLSELPLRRCAAGRTNRIHSVRWFLRSRGQNSLCAWIVICRDIFINLPSPSRNKQINNENKFCVVFFIFYVPYILSWV
jgi:hypothetical protein